MQNTLFLYLDFLGFSNLVIGDSNKVRRLFNMLDAINIHKDCNFKSIIFSDTLIAYNVLNEHSQTCYEFMFLVEFVQDIAHRLTGSNLFFRAIIRFGEFEVQKLTHFDAYFGEALINSYKDEKDLPVGLFFAP